MFVWLSGHIHHLTCFDAHMIVFESAVGFSFNVSSFLNAGYFRKIGYQHLFEIFQLFLQNEMS